MSKTNAYRDFLRALKRHWKTALPGVRPLTERRGALPMASTFYAGYFAEPDVHVYLNFQPHKNVGGKFTINVILSRDESSPRRHHSRNDKGILGAFQEGPNRIGRFVGARHGDKWWVLCRDESYEQFAAKFGLGLERRENYWYPESWDDPDEIIRHAVRDVTFDVMTTLEKLGHPTSPGVPAQNRE